MSGLIDGRVVAVEIALVRAIGPRDAIVLQQIHWLNNEAMYEGEATRQLICETSGLSGKQVRAATEKLTGAGILVATQLESETSGQGRFGYEIDRERLAGIVGNTRLPKRASSTATPCPNGHQPPAQMGKPTTLRDSVTYVTRDALPDQPFEMIVADATGPAARFQEFWVEYPHKRGKSRAETLWGKLSAVERDHAIVAIGWYRIDCEASERPFQQGDTFLSKRTFEDYPNHEPEAATASGPVAAVAACETCSNSKWVDLDDGSGVIPCPDCAVPVPAPDIPVMPDRADLR